MTRFQNTILQSAETALPYKKVGVISYAYHQCFCDIDFSILVSSCIPLFRFEDFFSEGPHSTYTPARNAAVAPPSTAIFLLSIENISDTISYTEDWFLVKMCCKIKCKQRSSTPFLSLSSGKVWMSLLLTGGIFDQSD